MYPFIPAIFPVCCLFAFVSVIGFSQYFLSIFVGGPGENQPEHYITQTIYDLQDKSLKSNRG